MRAYVGWSWALSLAVGCGGSKDVDPFGTGVGDDDDAAPVTVSCDIRTYNTDGMTCEQLGSAYENTMHDLDACNSDQDCRVEKAPCEHWNDVLCYYAVNFCIDEDTDVLDAVADFGSKSANCGDTSDRCDCGAIPEVQCVNHVCDFKLETNTR